MTVPSASPGQSDTGLPDGAPVAGGAVASGIAMKHRNPVAVWIGLTIITLGIYHLVWYFKIHKELAEFDRRRTIPTAGSVMVLIFLGWTVVAPLISYANTGKFIRKAQRSAGLPETCSPAAGTLLMLVFGVGTLYYQNQLNLIIDRYQAPEGTQIPLYA
ncbi:MAG TPA: DUF4234 domain-containing protein [Pseudonocardiaceae bacterium]|jgi:hypothetical protein